MFPAAATTAPTMLTLVLLSGLAVGSLNMFLPSLANIAHEFQADYALVSLSIAGYAWMAAVLQLLMGPLSDRIGRRPVILAGLVIFIVASLGCLLATNVWTFLLFRMLQAAIVSGYAVSVAVIRDSAEARKAASLMGYLAMGWAIAPMLGPVLGGVLDQFFGWRASFWAFLGFGAAVLALCWVDLGETNKSPSETFTKQFQAYPKLFRSRRFWGYSLCMAFSVGAFYAFLGGVPLVAATVFQMSPTALGIAMGSITGGFILGSFLSGRLASRHALTTMMIAGRIVACTGLAVGLGLLLAGMVHAVTLFGACMFVGVGNGLSTPSSSAGAASVRPELAGSASGLSGALSGAVGAVMSAITGAMLTVDNGPFLLLGMMLLSSSMALVAALYVFWLDRREPVTNPA
jgi:MFS transporter, DHA1 family, multidrug resistance protein